MNAARVPELDVLRFLAALAVVLFHYAFRGFAADHYTVMPYPLLAGGARYGYLGVELFFMISGFVILMTTASPQGGGVRGFIVSRIVRLYPAFWVCCTVTFLVTLAIGAPRFTASWSQYAVNLTMMSEFVDVASLDGAYWSLFVEIRFYAFIALVLLLRQMHRIEALMLAWLILSIALLVHPLGEFPSWLLMIDHSAFFIAGAAFFWTRSQGRSWRRMAMVLVSWLLAMTQSVRALRGFEEHYATPIDAVVVGALVTLFFAVMASIALRGRDTPSSSHARLLLLGALSYPLYLLHQNIGYMIFNAAYPQVEAHVLFWGTLGGMLLGAYAVHRFVERPLAGPMKRSLNRLTAVPYGRPRVGESA